MNLKNILEDAHRSAKKAAPDRVERRLKSILYGDIPTFMELPHAQTPDDLNNVDVAFLGIPWEGLKYPDPWTTLPATATPASPESIYYRTGADQAPDAIRQYSIFYSYNHGWGYFPELEREFILFNHLNAADYGNVDVDINHPMKSLNLCIQRTSDIYRAGAIPLVAGGDHAIPYPVIQSLANHVDGPIGIISFDSHFDLYYDPEFTAASQWTRLFELPQIKPEHYCSIGIRGLRNQLHEHFVAEKLGINYFTMADVEHQGIQKIIKNALKIAAGENIKALYVSLDIDVMDPAFCPAQKYPEPNGLTSREIIAALRQIGMHNLISGFDICCLGPQYDTKTGTSAQLCARIFMEVLATIAWQRKENRV